MKQFSYTISDPQGIHARPAGILVKEAGKFKSTISIEGNGKKADAKRIFGIMSLGVKSGQDIAVTVEGDDEDMAAAQLEAFFKENL